MTDAAPMNAGYSVSVLTTHSVDSQPSLLVAFDNQRYLFNTPESISRIALQNKVGLRKVGHVFLGNLEQSAGLPGFILSSVEAGNDKIQIIGPRGADHLLASCRFFTRRDKLSLKVTAPSSAPTTTSGFTTPSLPAPIHADSNLIVHAFPTSPSAVTASDVSMLIDPPIAVPPVEGGSMASPADSDGITTSLKRKRSSTSASPPPRPKSPPGELDQPNFDPTSPSFNPSHLRGASAIAWRSHVVRDMFRGEAFEPRPTAQALTSPSGRRISTPAYLPHSLPSLGRSFSPSSLSYLVIGPKKRGRFLPEKAKALGVKPGKAFSRLIAGGKVWVPVQTATQVGTAQAASPKQKETKKERSERIKREKEREEQSEAAEGVGEGKWVQADDCMGTGQDASAFLILNIPSPAHLPSLLTTAPAHLFAPSSLPPQTIFRSVFFFLGPSVLSSPLFSTYLDSLRAALPDGVEYRVTSEDFLAQGKNEVVFGPSALLNLRLSKLDSSMFQLPRYSFLPSPDSLALSAPLQAMKPNTHFSSTLQLLPRDKAPFGSSVRKFNFDVPSERAEHEAARLKGNEKMPEMLERAKAAWEEYMIKAESAKAEVERESVERAAVVLEGVEGAEAGLNVTPLGTGSAIPSKYRNVSSTLLHLPRLGEGGTEAEQRYILLDAGEGTWGQIARRFGAGGDGKPGKEEVLRGIKLLFLSHLHQDHHAGTITILRQRAKLDPAPKDPLFIVCPPNARTYLFEQQQLFNLGLYERGSGREVRFIDNPLLEPGKKLVEGSKADRTLNDLKALLSLAEVTAVPVLHRCRAWGVVVAHTSGWKVVFSGDTTPCDALVKAGQGASLLVHEATIEDDMPEVAEAKGHSTFGQAIDVATRMQARHLLLTHFSARYPKLPPVSTYTSTTSHRPVIATAFDLMTLALSDFWRVEKYRDAMDALLSWDEAEEGGVEGGEDGDELSGKAKNGGLTASAAEEEDGNKKGGKKEKRGEGKMSKRQEKKLQREVEVKRPEGKSGGESAGAEEPK
ncbi:hypothetical protein JCM11641_007673 [Rhodosporidiobolus odoratus]